MKQWRLFDPYSMKILFKSESREECMEHWTKLGKKLGVRQSAKFKIIRPDDKSFEETFKGIDEK